ncbi:MAG: flippase [Pseudomonadota bacterium]|nr:hypothetical protein [Alphaproteobacteria bacterium]MEE3323427.1 flippase [Pseudomonadota bacterium]|tara:strand:+ start:4280 stop:5611 length:1332 start_codon:yes stop_codon:yes gene_type:complete
MFSQLKKIDKEFFIKSSASFVIRIFSQAMALAIAVLLTRLLSVEGFGLYSITIATVMIAAIFVKDAAHLLWTRFAANYVAEENWGALKGALIAAFTYATLLGVGLIIILYMLRNTLVLAAGHFATAGFLISLWLIPIVGITFAFMGVLKGMKHVIWAQLPEFALRPFLLCLMLLVFFMWGPQTFNVETALSIYLICAVFALVVTVIFLICYVPRVVWFETAQYEWKEWGKVVVPLIVTSGLILVNQNADILMLGSIKGAEDAGLYQVATRTATLMVIVLTAVNAIITPKIAEHYAKEDLIGMQRLIYQGSLLISVLTLPLVVLFSLLAPYLLVFLYGEAYSASQTAFLFLLWAQAFNALAGPVGMVVIMTGRQKVGSICIAISTAVNIGLNAALIPNYGINGAAIATAISILVWNVMLAIYVWRDLKVNCTAIPFSYYKTRKH